MSLPIPTSVYVLRLDAATVAHASTLISASQAAYANYVASNPGAPSETITITDVYTAAAALGVNRWTKPAYWQTPPSHYQPTVATFTPHAGTGVTSVNVPVWTQTVTLANAIIAALGGVPSINDVLGCAVCTGVAALMSLDQVEGPFT